VRQARPWIDSAVEQATDDPLTQFELGRVVADVRADYKQQHPEKAAQLEKFIKIYQTSDKVKQTLNSEIGEKLWFSGWK
jgi:hypothetical protein